MMPIIFSLSFAKLGAGLSTRYCAGKVSVLMKKTLFNSVLSFSNKTYPLLYYYKHQN